MPVLFFTWSAFAILGLFFSFFLKINCLGNAARENESGERRVERGRKIRGRERERFVPTMATVGMLNTSGSLSGNYLEARHWPIVSRGKSNFTGLLASRRALWSRKTTKLEKLFSTPEINDHELVFDGV